KRLAVDAFLGRLWLALPATLMWTGFRANPTKENLPAGLIFMVTGVLLFFFIQVFWLRRRVAEDFTPHSLTVGELRDRAFVMAEKAGVKLNQIYVYPMARWRLANAYASEGNDMLLTDWLLSHLTVQEVDAV